MPSFVLYLLGFVILATGVLFGASILGVDNQWIAVIGLVLLGIGVKYWRLRNAFQRDKEASTSSTSLIKPPSDQLVTRKQGKADFLQARGVISNLHGVIDHNQETEEDDNDIPDVPVGYTSDFQISPRGKEPQSYSSGMNKQPPAVGST